MTFKQVAGYSALLHTSSRGQASPRVQNSDFTLPGARTRPLLEGTQTAQLTRRLFPYGRGHGY